MIRLMHALIYAFLLSVSLSGCFGLAIVKPEKCILESPTTFNPYFSFKYMFINLPAGPSTKEDFLRDWGKPDKITSTPETEEIWVYEKHNLWCGIIPAFVIAVPLILPVCNGFDQVYFDGDKAKTLYAKRSRTSGCYIPGACFNDPCWPPALYKQSPSQ